MVACNLVSLVLTIAAALLGFNVIEARSPDGVRDEQNSLTPPKSVGSVWPLPQSFSQGSAIRTLDEATFAFAYDGPNCPIVQSALDRYVDIIFTPPRTPIGTRPVKQLAPHHADDVESLVSLQVSLTGQCETWPYLEMDEAYEITVDAEAGTAQLVSGSVWGLLRGLESFSHLIYRGPADSLLYINSTSIQDFPRFKFRGLLLDTARHYLPVSVIKESLDAMAYNKFNVFHWHIVDDQSFPYQSVEYPNLSFKGAFRPITHVYTINDIESIIDYARLRGIRVVVEFDTPGHTLSWGLGQPDLLTQCYDSQGQPNGYGPIDPTLDSTYTFLETLFGEIADLFPDTFLHLGGDEVSFDCWNSSATILAFMQQMGFDTDFTQLESYYIDKLLNIVSELPQNKSYIVWQEVFDNGCQLKPDTVVNVWKSTPNYLTEMSLVTASGFEAILSSCWYLNKISYGSDWVNYYTCEPEAFNGTQEQFDLVMGGSATMWAEWVDATNLISRTWPRASAVGERLWSARTVQSTTEAAPRLEEHRCRMLGRNINAEPFNGPNYCDFDNLVE